MIDIVILLEITGSFFNHFRDCLLAKIPMNIKTSPASTNLSEYLVTFQIQFI